MSNDTAPTPDYKLVGPLAIVTVIVLTVGILRWPMVPVVLGITPLSILLAWKTRGI